MGKVRIGFRLIGDPRKWPGGLVHSVSLIRSLRLHCAERVSLFACHDGSWEPPSEILGLIEGEIVWGKPSPRRFTRKAHALARRTLDRDFQASSALARRGIDILVFGEGHLQYGIPNLAFLPDFQHVKLPDFFSEAERLDTDRYFAATAKYASRVLVASRSVLSDFQRAFPNYAAKAKVVRPIVVPPSEVYRREPREILEKYHLPEKFIYLPNQFFKHKNHTQVLHALTVLKQRHSDIFLVSTGYPHDYRDPTHFPELLRRISEMGLRGRTALLGLVSRSDVFSLMRQSAVVLNPSLFEGCGLTGMEAAALGKPLLLSDIPAHREMPADAHFFDPLSPLDLAEKLGRIWTETTAGPDPVREGKGREKTERLARESAVSLMSVIDGSLRKPGKGVRQAAGPPTELIDRPNRGPGCL